MSIRGMGNVEEYKRLVRDVSYCRTKTIQGQCPPRVRVHWLRNLAKAEQALAAYAKRVTG
jgi:hypothetical protein